MTAKYHFQSVLKWWNPTWLRIFYQIKMTLFYCRYDTISGLTVTNRLTASADFLLFSANWLAPNQDRGVGGFG